MMMQWITAIGACLLMVTGAGFVLIAAIGILRLPDLFTRMHAASKAGTVGSGFLLIALALESGQTSVWVKSIAALLFFIFTAPVSAHLLAKAARWAGADVGNLGG